MRLRSDDTDSFMASSSPDSYPEMSLVGVDETDNYNANTSIDSHQVKKKDKKANDTNFIGSTPPGPQERRARNKKPASQRYTTPNTFHFPFNQIVGIFRSKTEWTSLVELETLQNKGSTLNVALF